MEFVGQRTGKGVTKCAVSCCRFVKSGIVSETDTLDHGGGGAKKDFVEADDLKKMESVENWKVLLDKDVQLLADVSSFLENQGKPGTALWAGTPLMKTAAASAMVIFSTVYCL